MTRRRLMSALAAATAWVLLAWTPPAAQSAANHVVVISLDGFPAKALADPFLPVPTLRALAARGASAAALQPVDPTVTWANHTSMVTGVAPARHGVVFNGLLVREPGKAPRIEPWRDRGEMVHARTLYDAVHQAGMTTAQVDWVAIWNAPTITWEFRERPSMNESIPREMVQRGLIAESDITSFSSRNIVWRDEVWTTAAAYIIEQHRPNLMLFHLLNLDSTHHRYGPGAPAATTAMAHLDAQVARLVAAVDKAGLTGRTTFFVVSDHGFKAVKRHIRPNTAFMKAGLLTVVDGRVDAAQAYSVPEGGTALVFLTVPDPSGAILARVKQALAGVEGIDRIIESADYPRMGLPDPAQSTQAGALLLTAKDGYAFVDSAAEPAVIDAPITSAGSHGYVASDPDMQAIFIASGRGIQPGVRLPIVSTLDLAPTAARLLGVPLGTVTGRVLSEILAPDGR